LNRATGPLVLGAGKLEELKGLLVDHGSETDNKVLLVFDGELSPGQQRNLARELSVEVLDRTQVILRIFSQRARSRTAQLEIELAGLKYEAPRIRDDEALGDKQAGGGGRAAKGNTSVELRKQELKKRLAELKDEIEKAERSQAARRKRREQVSGVALVGYTNAGKSSWMRVLSGSEVLVQDALFATLDTTVRQLHPPTQPSIVVADTVGFLRNLPNHLLASFGSTLNEALDADLLLFVIDGSDPEWQAHLATTKDVLDKVGASEIPSIYVVNKLDQMTAEQKELTLSQLPDALLVSSRDEADVQKVRQKIIAFFDERLTEAELRIPFSLAALRAEIRSSARILSEDFDETGGLLRVRADEGSLKKWRERLEA
jgi:GTP-binding protein HflX